MAEGWLMQAPDDSASERDRQYVLRPYSLREIRDLVLTATVALVLLSSALQFVGFVLGRGLTVWLIAALALVVAMCVQRRLPQGSIRRPLVNGALVATAFPFVAGSVLAAFPSGPDVVFISAVGLVGIPFVVCTFWLVQAFRHLESNEVRTKGAHPDDSPRAARAHVIASEIAGVAHVPVPTLLVWEEDRIGAHAQGLKAKQPTLLVSSGALGLPDGQLRCLIAHEVAHLEKRHSLFMSWLEVLFGSTPHGAHDVFSGLSKVLFGLWRVQPVFRAGRPEAEGDATFERVLMAELDPFFRASRSLLLPGARLVYQVESVLGRPLIRADSVGKTEEVVGSVFLLPILPPVCLVLTLCAWAFEGLRLVGRPLYLTLFRQFEFAADAVGARLTGTPGILADALDRSYRSATGWDRDGPPRSSRGVRAAAAEFFALSLQPAPAERIRRLRAMEGAMKR